MTRHLPAKVPPATLLPNPGTPVKVTIEYDGKQFVTTGTFEQADWRTNMRTGEQTLDLRLRKRP